MESPESELRQLCFGDEREFVYHSCVEEVDASGEISELTIFFGNLNGSKKYGLTVELSDHEAERFGVPEEEISPAIETEHVDPRTVIDILRLPSTKLLTLAVEIQETASN